ncbi:MAG TPA: hypothetical protein PK788_03545 [Gemmatimonadaceae bacterium]|nr:hypothetical protein [Gemmatimonadaceae bacterium]
MTLRASSKALVLLVLAACGGDQQQGVAEEDVPSIEVVRPQFERALVASDGTLLSPRDVVSGRNSLLVLDESADEVWELPLAPSSETRRVSRPRRFGQSGVFAYTQHSAGLSLLGVDGALRVMDAADPDRLERTMRAFAPRHRPVALGESESGGWVTVHSLLVLAGDAAADSVIVSVVDTAGRVTRRYGFERAGPSRPRMFVADFVSARALGDRIVIGGAEPARVITVTAARVTVDTLENVPVRELNANERAGLDRVRNDARAPQMLREARVPGGRPAVRGALPIDGGFLVVAQGREAAQFVDLYCGRSFARTVLARPTIEEIFVTTHGIVAIDAPRVSGADAPAMLSYYAASDFLSECAK